MPSVFTPGGSSSPSAALDASTPSTHATAAAAPAADGGFGDGGGGYADGEREVCIVGFGRQVHVYNSKQKPKLLTVYCDDFRWGVWGWRMRGAGGCGWVGGVVVWRDGAVDRL